jgi:hypothetical protein
MKILKLLLLCVLLVSCNEEKDLSEADQIIAKAIEKAGGERYEKADIEFVFRDRTYSSSRKGGEFEYTRSGKDSLGPVKDVLNNEGFRRYRAGQEEMLSDSLAGVFAESVNSVHYFVQLPYGLQDEAVQARLVGEDTIKGKAYYEIEVTFAREGGGKDHEDVYMYWIQKEDFTIDYLAYRFFVNEGGIRFRVAKNPRVIKGIRFVDYENYKINDLSTPLPELDDLFMEDALIKVSDIQNEILKVEINN